LKIEKSDKEPVSDISDIVTDPTRAEQVFAAPEGPGGPPAGGHHDSDGR
jgi:hypothetical protein